MIIISAFIYLLCFVEIEVVAVTDNSTRNSGLLIDADLDVEDNGAIAPQPTTTDGAIAPQPTATDGACIVS